MTSRITTFSPCRTWRYTLWREFGLERDAFALFLGLNPSTADELKNDNTIRRDINFAKRWGFGALAKGNLFAYRATEPANMRAAQDPVGPENDRHLIELAMHAKVIICAWGAHGAFLNRSAEVLQMLKALDLGHKLHYFTLTKNGEPKHELYIAAETLPVPYLPSEFNENLFHG